MFFDIDGVVFNQANEPFYRFVKSRYTDILQELTGGKLRLVTQIQIDQATRKALEEGLNEFFIMGKS